VFGTHKVPLTRSQETAGGGGGGGGVNDETVEKTR
jgi:hypothetical protein